MYALVGGLIALEFLAAPYAQWPIVTPPFYAQVAREPGDFALLELPIMVRALDERVSEGLGKALAKVLRGKNAVLVASTDLSHFFKHEAALTYDRAMLSEIEAFNPVGAFDLDHNRKGFACGLGAFTAVLWACRKMGADKVKVLRHATSANVTGDYSSVVGYGAAAILKSK